LSSSPQEPRYIAPVTVMVIEGARSTGFGPVSLALQGSDRVSIVERLSDAPTALARAARLRPTLTLLDLDTPKLDAKTFLRLLMATSPMPVIAVSSKVDDATRDQICAAGAVELVYKPPTMDPPALRMLAEAILGKIEELQWVAINGKPRIAGQPAARVVAIGASTGGPAAVGALVEAMTGQNACFLVAQHLPARSTKGWAERLSRSASLPVYEARDGDRLQAGHVLIAPGGRHMMIRPRSSYYEVQTADASPSDRFAPSVDRLFESMAETLGPQAFGIILTGMGADGTRGAVAIRRAGGEVWAEGEHSATVFGMPKEAIAAGGVTRTMPLPELVPALLKELQRRIS
jgi:two-component system, chemotaxis family, protein-glutamate methylesterase/glutaminase